MKGMEKEVYLVFSNCAITILFFLYLYPCRINTNIGAAVNIDNYIFEREVSKAYEPNREVVHEGTHRMLRVALDAAAKLSQSKV
jgi:hypothetical protein